jgi:predicted AlkP superfamily pyrophosphatase or phosphodiesterase
MKEKKKPADCQKVVLFLVDGMRPDAMLNCGHPFVQELLSKTTYCMKAQTVDPAITMPAHFSMFHSVPPQEHGVLGNVSVTKRPGLGLFELLGQHYRKTAYFSSWDEMREVLDPGPYRSYLHRYYYRNSHENIDTDQRLVKDAIKYIKDELPEFIFVYCGAPDILGHNAGWMSAAYLQAVYNSMECCEQVMDNLPENYAMIVTADHGGKGRGHGMNIPECMNIPMCFYGKYFEKGKEIPEASILDVAPTIVDMMGWLRPKNWVGVSRVPEEGSPFHTRGESLVCTCDIWDIQ